MQWSNVSKKPSIKSATQNITTAHDLFIVRQYSVKTFFVFYTKLTSKNQH
jgi:hypothetical protein